MLSSALYSLLHVVFSQWIITLVSAGGTVAFCFCAYNKFLHPLRRFPGPFWGGVTDLYNTYLFSTREGHLRLLALHKKYGQFVDLQISVVSIELIENVH